MKRTIRKEFTLTRKEAEELKKKAKAVCKSEASLVRSLIMGYEPREAPKEEFYDAMEEMRKLSDNVRKLAEAAVHLTKEDRQLILGEVSRWHKLQSDIEKKFLAPEEGIMKWQ